MANPGGKALALFEPEKKKEEAMTTKTQVWLDAETVGVAVISAALAFLAVILLIINAAHASEPPDYFVHGGKLTTAVKVAPGAAEPNVVQRAYERIGKFQGFHERYPALAISQRSIGERTLLAEVAPVQDEQDAFVADPAVFGRYVNGGERFLQLIKGHDRAHR
jgi:hypothetical protein